MGDTITNVDKYRKGWVGGLPETECGSGSTLANTSQQREWIPDMIRKHEIKTVADIGAGDLNWIKQTEIPTICEYTAYDLVPRHEFVKPFDVLRDDVPKVDMIMLLWVLNHFPREQAAMAFERVMASGSKYLMITDRPIWKEDHPECLRDLPYIERIILNRKADCIMLLEL